jgi:hypothetical protein
VYLDKVTDTWYTVTFELQCISPDWDYSGWFAKIVGGVEGNTKVAVGGKRGFVLVKLIILPIFSILIGIFSSLMFQQSYKDTDSIYRNQQYK